MTTTNTKRDYLKRYNRPPDPPNFEITPRIVNINAEICRRPLIQTDQLRKRHLDIPDRVFHKIVSNLFANGFIARPRQQQEVHNDVPGSLPMYLNPDHYGFQLYETFFADPIPVPKYTQDNDRGTWSYMRHQHTTTTTLLHYEAGAQTTPGLTFLTEPQLWSTYAPAKHLNHPAYDLDDYPRLMAHDFIANPPQKLTRTQPKIPLKLSTRFDWPVLLPGNDQMTTVELPMATEPDGYFAHQLTRDQFFFFESDEGTETILPNQDIRQSMQLFFQTSLFAKYLAYIAAYRKRAHKKKFGITSFKVITDTTTPRRVDEMIRKLSPILTAKPLNIHPEFLLFTDRQTLSRFDSNPYHPDHRFKTLAGDSVHVLSV